MMKAKSLSLLLVFVLMLTMILSACGSDGGQSSSTPEGDEPSSQSDGGDEPSTSGSTYTTLVVGQQEFNGIFNPILAHTAYDVIAGEYMFVMPYNVTRDGSLESYAAEYTEPEEITNEAGEIVQVIYTIKLKEGMVFSDGTPVTADDLIFSLKIYLDPSYDGLSTMRALDIEGLKAYTVDDENYEAKEAEIDAQVAAMTDEQVMEGLIAMVEAELDSDYGGDLDAMAADLVDYIGMDASITERDAVIQFYADYLLEAGEDATVRSDYKAQLMAESIQANIDAGGANVPDVSGIQKVDELTVTVTVNGFNPMAIYQIGETYILPEHYYGPSFVKGDLTQLKTLNLAPLGSGAYTYESWENNILTLRSNPTYFNGEPKIPTLRYQKVDTENRFESVQLGEVDIADPSASVEMVEQVEAAGLHYELIDNNGYGYIGINAHLVTDKNVRKALMHLMNRGPAVVSYYGELADIIERPISQASWAYPTGAAEYYGYDKDKALEYFEAAGYTQENGQLVKDGEQFSIELWLSSETHPVVPVFQQMKSDIEGLGGVCDIVTTDWNVYNEAYKAGTIPVWAAAWNSSVDPDMYQIYHSTQVATGNNPYRVENAELDALIEQARSISDQDERKALYAQAYDIVMDEAVEMPFYQRKNMWIFNQEIVNVDTIPENLTPFFQWYHKEVNLLELH